MNGTTITMIGHLSMAPAFQDGLYTPERHLFYLAMETFLYEYRKSIGMLSAYAEPFYPPTEENQHDKDIIKEASVQNNETVNTANLKDDKTNQDNKPVSTKEKKSIQETFNVIEEDWVQVKHSAKTKEVCEAIQKAYIENVKNCYAALKVDEEVVDEKDDIKKVLVVKKAAEEHRIMYNVNNITIEEMVQHINDYKKNDVIANAPEETKKEKKNSSDFHKRSSNQSEETQEETEKNIIVESDSEMEEETNDDDSITNENDLMNDDVDSDDAFTINSTDEESSDGEKLESEENEEEENLNGNEERDHKMKQLLYQNDLLLFRLEEAEMKEEKLLEEMYLQTNAKRNDTNQEVIKLQKQLKDKEKEWRIKVNKYEYKIETVEKALAMKTK